ncbi:MAG: hypothetical protein SAL07_25245 [Oscillatoria sp. PMC 1051.18]|nr:hypothetical protein [Oscillatoria sp. PMC 1050.18]MEC5033213.1 hypothetical protein [Oscillatoria sp. PMC 1051.18]
MLIQQAPAAGNGSGGDGGKEERFETPNERVRREIRKQFPGVFEYTHGSGFEDWD